MEPRRGLIERFSRLPDLTSADFFLCGHFKSLVHKYYDNMEMLKQNIQTAL